MLTEEQSYFDKIRGVPGTLGKSLVTDLAKVHNFIGEMIKGDRDFPRDIQKYIPDYEYLLYDISRFTDEEIKGKAINKIAMTTLRDIFTKDIEGIIQSIYKMSEYIVELEDKQTGIEYFKTLIRYIFSARVDLTKEAVKEIINLT